jgi:hypothetical protein
MNDEAFEIDRKLTRQKNRPWDQCDDIATAILALIRAQNLIQSLHDASAYGAVADAKYAKAYAAREQAMRQLLAARDAFKAEQALAQQARQQRRHLRLIVAAAEPRLRAEIIDFTDYTDRGTPTRPGPASTGK